MFKRRQGRLSAVFSVNIFRTTFSSVSIVDLLCAISIMLHP